jgi:trigger factor
LFWALTALFRDSKTVDRRQERRGGGREGFVPEQYHAEQLAGKEALFKVEVLNIARKELPEVDDEFAKDLGYDDMEALTKSIKEKLKAEKEASLRSAAREMIMDKLIEETAIDIPPQMLNEKVEETKQNYESRIKGSGIDPETYYKYIFNIESDKDESDQIAKLIKAQVEKDIKTDLILEKVVALEKIEATEEDLENEYKNLAASYKQPLEEFKKSVNSYLTEYLKAIVAQNKAYDFLVDQADTSVEKAK